MPRAILVAAALAALSACDKKSDTAPPAQSAISIPSPDALASPSKADVKEAFSGLLDRFPHPTIALGGAAQSTQCQPGMTSQGQVQACKVCFVIVDIVPREQWADKDTAEIIAQRGTADIAFKRAISYAQPDIAPVGSEGVWVPTFPPAQLGVPAQMLSFTPAVSHVLTPEDLAKLGLTLVQRGPFTQIYEGSNRYHTAESVKNLLLRYPISEMVYPLVGTCNGPA